MEPSFEHASSAGLQKRGQYLYRRKQYDAALHCFDEAIALDPKVPLSILDNRSATHTKLGDLRAALRDGRQMIQQVSSSCAGYLRTGRVLQILGKRELALDIYQRGVRKVLPSDPNIILLRELSDKLTKQCAPLKTIDPLAILPLELAEMAISHLTFRETVNLVRVSKSWRNLLNSTPNLWKNLDFSDAKCSLTLSAIRQYLKSAGGSVTSMTLDRYGRNQESILNYVTSRCRVLQELVVSSGFVGASLLKSALSTFNLSVIILLPGCETTSDTVSQILSQCPNLEQAEFHHINNSASRQFHIWEHNSSKLHTLVMTNLSDQNEISILVLELLVPKIPNIRVLSLQGWDIPIGANTRTPCFRRLYYLRNLNLSRISAPRPPRLPPSLRVLSLENNYFQHSSRNMAEVQLPELISLSVHCWQGLPYHDLQLLLDSNKGNLTRLSFTADGSHTKADTVNLIQLGYLEKVEELKLKECFVDDEIAVLLAKNLPGLRLLDIGGSKITGVGIKALVTNLKDTLETLCLIECKSTSVDAVEFARSMNIRVKYGFPDALRKGKKVRLQA